MVPRPRECQFLKLKSKTYKLKTMDLIQKETFVLTIQLFQGVQFKTISLIKHLIWKRLIWILTLKLKRHIKKLFPCRSNILFQAKLKTLSTKRVMFQLMLGRRALSINLEFRKRLRKLMRAHTKTTALKSLSLAKLVEVTDNNKLFLVLLQSRQARKRLRDLKLNSSKTLSTSFGTTMTQMAAES